LYIVIYANDITNITGKKERTARKILADIRRKYNKKPGQSRGEVGMLPG
jgi:hypothetical protein